MNPLAHFPSSFILAILFTLVSCANSCRSWFSCSISLAQVPPFTLTYILWLLSWKKCTSKSRPVAVRPNHNPCTRCAAILYTTLKARPPVKCFAHVCACVCICLCICVCVSCKHDFSLVVKENACLQPCVCNNQSCAFTLYSHRQTVNSTVTVRYNPKSYYTVRRKIRSKPYQYGWPYFAFLQGKRRSRVQLPIKTAFLPYLWSMRRVWD